MKLIFNSLVILIFCAAFMDGTRFRCDYKYNDIGWFKYHEIPTTWDNARLRCHLEGGILASPTTYQMNILMTELFNTTAIFTGIAATFSKGDFYSIDGIPLSQIPHEWASLEPDNKMNDENCITLDRERKLSDVNCDERHPYICFREDSKVDINNCGTPDPDYHFETKTNKCYKFHTKAKNFTQAYFACSAEGAHLAIINSEKEAGVISKIFENHPTETIVGSDYKSTAIIGYKYWHANDEWMTIHGQSIHKAGYAKFGPGQPDNVQNEFCGTIFRNGLLNDGDCKVKYPFICEKIPYIPPVCYNGIR